MARAGSQQSMKRSESQPSIARSGSQQQIVQRESSQGSKGSYSSSPEKRRSSVKQMQQASAPTSSPSRRSPKVDRGNMGIEARAAQRAAERSPSKRQDDPYDFTSTQWQPTSSHPNIIRGIRPDVTPINNPKNYRFRDAPPSSKGWGLASGDELGLRAEQLDVTPVVNPRHHRFREGPPGTKGWHPNAGDELMSSRMPLDTTPLGQNIKNFKFRDNGVRKFAVVKKAAKPLIAYYE